MEWGGVVAHEILVSTQGPLVLGFWVLGLRVGGQGLTLFLCQDRVQDKIKLDPIDNQVYFLL